VRTDVARSANLAPKPCRRGHKLRLVWRGNVEAQKASSGCERGHQGTCSCFWVGWAQYGWFGRNGAHAAGRTSFHGRNSASTCTALVSTTVQRGARAPCCRRNGRAVQPCIGTAAAARNSSSAFQRAARHLTACSLRAPPARGNKAPGARSESAAHCGNPGTGVQSAVVTAGHSRAAGEAEAGTPRKWRAPALCNDRARATRTISRALVAKKTTHRVDECGR
jgi:hypothetical protein